MLRRKRRFLASHTHLSGFKRGNTSFIRQQKVEYKQVCEAGSPLHREALEAKLLAQLSASMGDGLFGETTMER